MQVPPKGERAEMTPRGLRPLNDAHVAQFGRG